MKQPTDPRLFKVPPYPKGYGQINCPAIGPTALLILKAVYLGNLNGPEVAAATGIELAEVNKIARGLVRRGWLCAFDDEDWCIRDTTRAIPELAALRGVPCSVAPRGPDPRTRDERKGKHRRKS
jgi:hypothetical protein